MKKATIFFISALAFLNIAFSQKTTVDNNYEVLKKNYYKYASEKMTTLSSNQVSKLFKYKLNLKNVQEINNLIGDDIIKIVLHRNQDYRSKSVFRPQVVVGTVVSQTYDTREEAFFHTEWAVKIDEIVADDGNIINKPSNANTLLGKNIYIKSMTGMIGDRYRNITHVKKLVIGEKVLLFIAPVRNAGKRRFLNEREMLKNFNISSVDNLDKSFTITGGYTIKFNNVFDMDGNRLGALDDIKKITKQIIDINSQDQFEKDFSLE